MCSFDLLYWKNLFGGEYIVFVGFEECIWFVVNFKFMDDDIEYFKDIMFFKCEVSISF